MIKLKFKNKDNELEFFKKIPFLNTVEHAGIKFAEMVKDLDIAESEKEDE